MRKKTAAIFAAAMIAVPAWAGTDVVQTNGGSCGDCGARPSVSVPTTAQSPVYIKGEFMVSFAPPPDGKFGDMHLSEQKTWLEERYGVEVVRTFNALSYARGGGIFFIRARGLDENEERALLDALRSDPLIAGAERNGIQSASGGSVGNSATTNGGFPSKNVSPD